MLIFNLLMLTIIIVFVIDISGFQMTVKKMIWKWLKGSKTPFVDFDMKIPFCSLCMTHHILLIYVIVIGRFSLGIWALICLIACFTPIIKDIILLTRDFLGWIIDRAYNIFQ